ncbi:hypothetical protein ACGFZH_14295 [Streptomyces zaomyceticus]|uniref:hypothetical protein n=1 Tax=Streptomyces zaomyceticus TaxID=68286 RepID=UPI003722920F
MRRAVPGAVPGAASGAVPLAVPGTASGVVPGAVPPAAPGTVPRAVPGAGRRAAQGRHGAPRVPAVEQARRRLAAALLGAGALAATLLTASVTPAAPPAPDREPGAASSDLAQLSRD